MPSVWDRTHASRPAQRVASVCSFFSFVSFSLCPTVLTVLSDISLSISSLAALYRCSAFDSVPVSKLFVLSTISPFTTPFPPFAAFRSRISASLLNNCPLRRNHRIERSRDTLPVDPPSISEYISYLTLIHACNFIYHDSCCITVREY